MDYIEDYRVYALVNEAGYITAVNSSAFLTDTADWAEIDSGSGYKYRHAQGNYFPQSIMTDSGVWRYKLENGSPRECTAEEIVEQETLLPDPSQDMTLTVYDELENAYQEGVNSI